MYTYMHKCLYKSVITIPVFARSLEHAIKFETKTHQSHHQQGSAGCHLLPASLHDYIEHKPAKSMQIHDYFRGVVKPWDF